MARVVRGEAERRRVSLRGYVKKGKPALWKQMQDEAGEVTYALNVRAEVRRQEREARRNDENRRRRIEAIKRSREPKRKRIAPMSEHRRAELLDYGIARKLFLRQRPNCEACPKMVGMHPCVDARSHPATDVHHKKGRQGKLLLNQKHWIPCCSHSHDFIHRNPAIARALDLLAQPGEWNRQD